MKRTSTSLSETAEGATADAPLFWLSPYPFLEPPPLPPVDDED